MDLFRAFKIIGLFFYEHSEESYDGPRALLFSLRAGVVKTKLGGHSLYQFENILGYFTMRVKTEDYNMQMSLGNSDVVFIK